MSNHFNIEVSKRLRELGVETTHTLGCEPFLPFTYSRKRPEDEYELQYGTAQPWITEDEEHTFPAYTLHDIFRKLEDIAEKVHGYNKVGWADFWAMHMSKLFREGDYPKAEQYLMSIITKDHGK